MVRTHVRIILQNYVLFNMVQTFYVYINVEAIWVMSTHVVLNNSHETCPIDLKLSAHVNTLIVSMEKSSNHV